MNYGKGLKIAEVVLESIAKVLGEINKEIPKIEGTQENDKTEPEKSDK